MPDSKNGGNHSSIRDLLIARPRRGRVNLAAIDPSETSGVKRHQADEWTLPDEEHVMALQEALHAEAKRSILIVLQGMDASGKDGTIRHVMSAFNPMGCPVASFKVPTAEELAHDFLWRENRAVPRLHMVGVFNRSHYEGVLVERVHERQLPLGHDLVKALLPIRECDAVLHDLRAQCPRRRDLGRVGILGNEDERGQADRTGSEGHRLRVVARAHGDEAFRSRTAFEQREHRVERTSGLEGTGDLKTFRLETKVRIQVGA